ncbi:tRNA (adenosine(37)-N6)-dimethylallyltransferase MiaA [Caldanaerobius polysaccharolyticus]|uniref:tRNA (adenosine(37)-N6)-dimethylallyltransferase MiaA n=1 Tax=Caldanaerobius polysaccharolyticus TaxID=44256 RepID=UPI000478F88C|nr:tRNA (adenosine(37)-N6)-dimethylallyltransferase MiaA [Caldanaerobius polysaccharolyticus]
MIPLIVIVGPTAVGKTEVSIDLALKINGEIVSADSMQVYKYMDIGTAKPSLQERKRVPHFMIDVVTPDQEFSVAVYKKMATKIIEEIYKRNHMPIVVGGTGLYVNSIVNVMDFSSTADWKLRQQLKEQAKMYGNEYLYEKLKKVDPITYKRIHPNDIRRIIRALEVYKLTGKPISYYQEITQNRPNPEYNALMIGLTMDRQKLYKRIEERVDKMIKDGLIEEIKWLCDNGYKNNMIAMQGLGYKEIIRYLEGQCTLEEAIEILKRDTRRYAKRQLTWFRKDKRIHWFYVDQFSCKEEITKNILELVAEKYNLR